MSERGPGRPAKYSSLTIVAFSCPAELKEYLRKVSRETGRSISEIIVEALTEYFKIKGVRKPAGRGRETARKIFGRMEMERLEREIQLHEKMVSNIEKAVADNSIVLKYRGRTLSPLQLIIRELNSLWGLEKKILALENRGLNVVKYADRVVKLIQRLDQLKEKTPI